MEQKLFPIYLENLSSNTQKAITLSKKSSFGRFKNGKVVYSAYEILYLIETKKAAAMKNNKSVAKEKLIKFLSKNNKNFHINYLVFKDLRKKGHIIKTGLKFGTEFRLYRKNSKNKHATHLVVPIKQTFRIELKDFASTNRIAHSTGKKMLLAVVDSQEDVTYFETSWFKA